MFRKIPSTTWTSPAIRASKGGIAVSASAGVRATRMTRCPKTASFSAVARPRPRPPTVTSTVLITLQRQMEVGRRAQPRTVPTSPPKRTAPDGRVSLLGVLGAMDVKVQRDTAAKIRTTSRTARCLLVSGPHSTWTLVLRRVGNATWFGAPHPVSTAGGRVRVEGPLPRAGRSQAASIDMTFAPADGRGAVLCLKVTTLLRVAIRTGVRRCSARRSTTC